MWVLNIAQGRTIHGNTVAEDCALFLSKTPKEGDIYIAHITILVNNNTTKKSKYMLLERIKNGWRSTTHKSLIWSCSPTKKGLVKIKHPKYDNYTLVLNTLDMRPVKSLNI